VARRGQSAALCGRHNVDDGTGACDHGGRLGHHYDTEMRLATHKAASLGVHFAPILPVTLLPRKAIEKFSLTALPGSDPSKPPRHRDAALVQHLNELLLMFGERE